MATGCAIVVGPATCLSEISIDLKLESGVQKGFFLGLPFWGLGVVSVFSGWIAERLGYCRLLVFSALIQVVGMLTIADADTKIQAYVGSLVTGLGRGMPAAPMTALVCSLFKENRTSVTNILHGFFYVGMMSASAVVWLLMVLGLEWRTVFQIFSVTVALFGAGASIVRFPSIVSKKSANYTGLPELFRNSVFIWVDAGIFFSGITELVQTTWLPYFVKLASGTNQEFSILTLFFLGLTMAMGRFVCASVASKIGMKNVFTMCGLGSAISIGMAALPVGTYFTVFWLMVLGLMITVSFPTIVAYASDHFPTANTSMFALLNAAAVAGGIVGPSIIGITADVFGLRQSMGMVALAPLLLLFSLRRTVYRYECTKGIDSDE